MPEVSVAASNAVAAACAKPAQRGAMSTASVEVPQCYRVESATGAAATWGPVPLPFVIALDAPATGASARVLTPTGQESEARAVFERRGGDSLLFTLRRIGYTGTLAVGVPGEVRAGVMRSAPTGAAGVGRRHGRTPRLGAEASAALPQRGARSVTQPPRSPTAKPPRPYLWWSGRWNAGRRASESPPSPPAPYSHLPTFPPPRIGVDVAP